MPSLLREHQTSLLLERRCATCAEALRPRELWSGAPCPWCRQPVFAHGALDADRLVGGVTERWARWRVRVYVLVGISCLLGSVVPLLAPVLYALAMILANFFLIRGPLRWLSPARRLATRLSLKVLLALFTMFNLVLSVVIFPLVGVAQLTTALISVGLAVAYVEAALRLTSRGLRREGAREGLHVSEWLPPALLLAAMTAFVVGVSAVLGGAFWLLLQVEIPGVSTLVDWLTGSGAP